MVVQLSQGLHLEVDIEDITSDTHGFHIKSLVWCQVAWGILEDIYFRRENYQMPKEKNQNTRKLLYSREEIDEWLYLRKQFYSIVFTSNLSCRD